MTSLPEIIERSKIHSFDLDFSEAKKWKEKDRSRVLTGFLPIYFPREIVHAAGGLAVGIMGTGDRKQIIKGDAYYQSYICHMPRGIIEMALSNNLDHFDGFIFPSICDVIRNLTGMFQVLHKGKFVKYMDFPQNFKSDIGGTFYQQEMSLVLKKIHDINKVEVTKEKLNHAIGLFKERGPQIGRVALPGGLDAGHAKARRPIAGRVDAERRRDQPAQESGSAHRSLRQVGCGARTG